MNRIASKLWCHLSFNTNKRHYVGEIRASEGKEVHNFQDLVQNIAYISYNNPDLNLYFRGQSYDYKNKKGVTFLYPSIFRNIRNKVRSGNNLDQRFKILERAQKILLSEIKAKKIDGHESLIRFNEIQWAILQHYEVCLTPLIDVTTSLRAACSFAFHNDNNIGFLYILGLPHVNGSISYYVEDELLNIKLSSICPPQALRPYFQEGLLVGSFPMERKNIRWGKIDIASRLIAKFKLIKSKFWDKSFTEIPINSFFPPDDPFLSVCKKVKEKLKKEFNTI